MFFTFIAANPIPGVRKPQVILTNQTTTVYKLSTNLTQQQTPPLKINKLSMEKIIEFMAKNYDPKHFLIRESYNFWHDMKCKPGETPNEIVARIRQNRATRKFSAVKDPQDEAFRTRFICSINNEAVLKAIFKLNDDEVNFEKAIDIAVKVEESAKVTKAQVYGSKGSLVYRIIKEEKTKDQPKKDETNSTYKRYQCNKKGHKENGCRFLDSVCNFCNRRSRKDPNRK